MKKYFIVISILTLVFLANSCKKDSTSNPYDDIVRVENENPDFGSVSSSNFAYLHEKIFKPTCANSGCHDGSFEPEFRSITSTYNSLVNQPVISNDETNSYSKRVAPGSYSESLLNARLTMFLPNTSGVMPLEVDEDGDWNDHSETYISLIQDWITAGAPDMFGNLPGQGTVNFPPSINGLVVFPQNDTSTPYTRDPDAIGITPIRVDAAAIDIWVRLEDDQLASDNIPTAEFKYGTSIENIDNSSGVAYNTDTSISALDFSDNSTTFYHKASLDLSSLEAGTNVYIRSVLNDGTQAEDVEVPNAGSSQVVTSIFVLQVQ